MMIPTHEERTISYHTVTLGELTRAGEAVAEISDINEAGETQQRTLYVPAGLPGELVTIAVETATKPLPGKRRRHWKPRPPSVWITEIHQASPLRAPSACPVFGTCGGCQLQHMHYPAQLAWKYSQVKQLLQEIGHFEQPPLLATVPCDEPWHYRNHMRFSVNRDGQLGLTARGSHRILPLTDCSIAQRQINQVLHILQQHPNPRPQALIRCATTSNQILLQPAPDKEIATQLAAAGLDPHTDTMEEVLGGQTFRIRPSSFFQTNTAQAEKMVQMVLQGLLTKSEHDASQAKKLTIVDAYCGVGTFAIILAQHVGKVITIEESASAIKDAQWNARDLTHIEIIKGKVEDMLPTLSTQIDGFIIDPPRAGCQPQVLAALANNPVARIVYVSCDPSTLARDLDILCHIYATYQLRSVQPLDMFPQTAHIECIAVLERKQV